jgi:hypothetical protein
MTAFIKYLRNFGTLVALMAIAASSAHAQKNDPPSNQFGVGIYGVTNFLPSGFEITYALDSTTNVQIGSELSASFSTSVGSFLIAPFVRYLYQWIVSPFAQGGIQLYSLPGSTQVGLFLGGGGAFCINRQINVHGDVDILNAFFTPSTNIGWFVFRLGADYFF